MNKKTSSAAERRWVVVEPELDTTISRHRTKELAIRKAESMGDGYWVTEEARA